MSGAFGPTSAACGSHGFFPAAKNPDGQVAASLQIGRKRFDRAVFCDNLSKAFIGAILKLTVVSRLF